MKINDRIFNGGGYINPSCQIIEVTQEGILCSSVGEDMDFNSTLDGYVQKDETYW